LDKVYKDSVSKADFFSKLMGKGLTMYERGGKLAVFPETEICVLKRLGLMNQSLQNLIRAKTV